MMTDKNTGAGGGPALVIVLGIAVVAVAIILVLSIGTSTVEQAAPEVASAGNGDAEVTTVAEPATPEEPAKLTPEQKFPGEELAKLPLELPNPVFAGTPMDVPEGRRMLPPTGLPREPYIAPAGLKNVAFEKTVTASDDLPLIGSLDLVTDGDKEALDGRYVELAPGVQWVQVDLENQYEIFAIVMWFNHIEARVYRGIVVQTSNDPEFKEGVVTHFNNDWENTVGLGVGEDYEYFESFEGYLVEVPGTVARYVRVYTNGSTTDDQNHYTELEVWAREPK